MPATAANPIDPKMLGILAESRAAGGAPYTPVGPTGSPFIVGGGTPYTPNTRGIGGGMSIGSYGQWALPRPAGVSLGYVPTAQTIGSAANDIVPKTLDQYLPAPAPAAEPKKKQNYVDMIRRVFGQDALNAGRSDGGFGGFGGGYSRGASSGYGGSAKGGRGGFGGSSARSGGLY